MGTYLDIERLTGYLKVAEKTLRKWVLHQKIQFHKILGIIRFRVSEIEQWVTNGCYALLTEWDEINEIDVLFDAVSLDELVEKELRAGDEEKVGGEA